MVAPTDTQPARQLAHVLLDCAIAMDPDGAPLAAAGVELAAARALEVDAIRVGPAPAGLDADMVLDLSQLLGGSVVLVSALIDALVARSGEGREAVVAEIRELVDRAL
jgi:hypothetical protein